MNERIALLLLVASALPSASLYAQGKSAAISGPDSDGDGLNDSLEAALLTRFSPVFMVSRHDCSIMPAQFVPEISKPTAAVDDGTIYGQAFPRKNHAGEVELHYYHLWRRDCGELGHPLDAEHVSALIHVDDDAGSAKALYWYAAAHEETICDAGHLSRAAAISAENHGATIWISPGKHASFLSHTLCARGCGGDRCEEMKPLMIRAIVNVGEAGAPMSNIAWLLSSAWPLRDKMRRSDFTDGRLLRVNKFPHTDVVWADPSRRPAQAAILGLNAGIGGAAAGARATDTALTVSNNNTSTALGTASDKTGDALSKSSRSVWGAVKKSINKTSEFLHPDQKK